MKAAVIVGSEFHQPKSAAVFTPAPSLLPYLRLRRQASFASIRAI